MTGKQIGKTVGHDGAEMRRFRARTGYRANGPFVARSWNEAMAGWGAPAPAAGEHTKLLVHRCQNCGDVYHCSGVYGCEHRRCLKRSGV